MRQALFAIALLLIAGCQASNPEIPSETVVQSAPSQQPELFSEGLEFASNAAEKTQTATTITEWEAIVQLWNAATQKMSNVPDGDPNYEMAQTKAAQYTQNQEYAQQVLEKLQAERNTEIQRGQEIIQDAAGDVSVAGAATSDPVVWVVIPESTWESISNADKLSLVRFAQNFIDQAKSNAEQHTGMDSGSPLHEQAVLEIKKMDLGDWQIIVSYSSSPPLGIDKTVLEGNSAWERNDPCCRGMKFSEFMKQMN